MIYNDSTPLERAEGKQQRDKAAPKGAVPAVTNQQLLAETLSERSEWNAGVCILEYTARRKTVVLTLRGHLKHFVDVFVSQVLQEWKLEALAGDLQRVTHELLAWMLTNGASTECRLVLTRDEPFVHVEVLDRGGLVPSPYVSLADAELAVRLLKTPVIEWGSELDSRGRCLWVCLSAANL